MDDQENTRDSAGPNHGKTLSAEELSQLDLATLGNVNWNEVNPFTCEIYELTRKNLNQNFLRLIFHAMCVYHQASMDRWKLYHGQLIEERNTKAKQCIEYAQITDTEIADLNKDKTKLNQTLKSEKSKLQAATRKNNLLKGEINQVAKNAKIKQNMSRNTKNLKIRIKGLESELKSLNDSVIGLEYKRLTYGKKIHQKLDSIYKSLKLPVKELEFVKNEPEREFRVYTEFLQKIRDLERHLNRKNI